MNEKDIIIQESVLTSRMDIGSEGFNELQAILLEKSNQRSEAEKREIELFAIRFKMDKYLESKEDEFKSTGYFLKSFLNALNIKQKDFAEYLEMKPSNLSKLISGERNINYDLALIFGKLFNHNPMLWIEIQAKNELQKLKNADRSKYENISLNDLINNKRTAG